jgi:hypothetical protein
LSINGSVLSTAGIWTFIGSYGNWSRGQVVALPPAARGGRFGKPFGPAPRLRGRPVDRTYERAHPAGGLFRRIRAHAPSQEKARENRRILSFLTRLVP